MQPTARRRRLRPGALVGAGILAALVVLPGRAGQPLGAATTVDRPMPPSVRAPTAPGRRMLVDSNVLVFQAGRPGSTRTLTEIDAEQARTVQAINRTRGTYQSYLLYTTPEMKVPILRPGFTITLPPPSRDELEKRRKAREARERGEIVIVPEASK